MSDIESQRQQIISSVFARRNANGSDETYVCHLKIWEDAGDAGGRKPRYILLSQSNSEGGFMHKSKLNANGTFSVGKTWRVRELRALQVVNPLSLNITLSRRYTWDTESREEQAQFLEALVRLFRTTVGPAAPLHLEGVNDYESQDARQYQRSAGPSTSSATLASSSSQFTTRNSDYETARTNPSPARSNIRNGTPSNQQSLQPPEARERTISARSRDGGRNRPPSITVPPLAPAPTPPRQTRRPSNAASTHSQTTSQISQASQPRPQAVSSTFSRDSRASGSTREATYSQISQSSDTIPPRSSDASPVPSQPTRKYTARSEAFPVENTPSRRDQNVRISYFDPTNQASLDRLLAQNTDSQIDIDGEEESARATLTNVEEMIEGYEWASDDVIGRKSTRGAVDLIQARLLDELTALEKANVHSFLESDDRIGIVMKFLDEAITELDNMDSLISSYKIHLNAVSEDILFIQSQNRGLQVQTQNQRALLQEIQNLLRTVHVDQDALITLTQGSLEKAQSIQRLEEAAAELYKALQAGRDTDMAATMERLQEYRTHNAQFCKRMFDFLTIMFTAQSKLLIGDTSGLSKSARGYPLLLEHQAIEEYLGRYAGLMLYLKEMDESVYAKLCASYFSTVSELHQTQITGLLSAYLGLIKKAQDDEQDASGFAGSGPPLSKSAAGMRRAGTILRSPLENRRDKEKPVDGELRASVAFDLALEQIQAAVYREFDFITDFLQINDAGLTFADYMGLDSYFRRQAARAAGLSQTTLKLIRNAMDLIFGFLPAELKTWLDNAIAKDNIEIVGILVTLERYFASAEQKNTNFLLNLLDKQQTRLKTAFERHISDQLKGIEQTRLVGKKRRGVTHFIKYFSSYVTRVENQLGGAEGFEIRTLVDSGYEKIVQAMFESLKQLAKLEGEGEDKGQLNYHIIMIENMHHFVTEISKMELGATRNFAQRAQSIYDENLNAYIKVLMRRPLAKLVDFFDAVERVGQDPGALAANSNYSKSSLKKVVKEFNAKDMRKHIDGMFKRVEKHFTEDGTEEMVAIVWKACEQGLVNMTGRIGGLISQHYGDSGVTLEFTKTDIESACRKQL
ncbi:exocyst protein [Coprinopsis cinerea okayama7|uniref:Exocyst protein n=1 Tax=Coprinopsis cinerea (strain Okayama-7 / 130 / ATCC MYA-4618 / FGSC 9003) TaxID=240176 RepID=A8N2B3_COPC7|nr:exocyst protein [Coprinopsis cinerea okayama7\|eukprot:XP_001829073.2 exocyst protein [Coprinopsis cinerea okayama7\